MKPILGMFAILFLTTTVSANQLCGKLPNVTSTCAMTELKKACGDFATCMKNNKAKPGCAVGSHANAIWDGSCASCDAELKAKDKKMNDCKVAAIQPTPIYVTAKPGSFVPEVPKECFKGPELAYLVAFDQAGSCSGTNCPCTYKPCPGEGYEDVADKPGWAKKKLTNPAGKTEWEYCTQRSCKMTQPRKVTCYVYAK